MSGIESRLLDSGGHVYTFKAFDEDQTGVVMQCFFFTWKNLTAMA